MAGSRRLTRLGTEVVARVGHALGENDAPLVVALSGGADSAVLAWAILEDRRKARAIHVHHGWPASDRMEAAATAVAARLAVPLEHVRVDASGPGSPEAVARQARYAALGERVQPEELVVTGHTLTDQAETVLGNLMWGAGLDGLRGIHRRRGGVVRPLLDVTRDETRELASLLRLPFLDDPANEDDSFRRVRIRRLLAGWERSPAPGVGRRLAGLARVVESDLEFLEQAAADVEIEQRDGAVRVPSGVLRTVPRAVAARVIRRALRVVGGGYPGAGRDVEAVLDVARAGKPARITGGYPVVRVGAYVVIGSPSRMHEPSPLVWSLEGTARWGRWAWEAQERGGRPAVFPLSRWRQVFDCQAVEGRQVIIRTAERGDRIALRRGRKLVSEALAEAGIPPAERPGWPVLMIDGRVAWIPGVRRAYGGWTERDTMGHVLVSATREERWRPVGY